MHAEAACETNDLDEAKRKLEMVRARARNGQSVLPEIKTTDKDELREKIRHERRIELRWNLNVISTWYAGELPKTR